MATVSARMSRNVLVVPGELTLADAARRMVERGVGSVVVMDGERLAGILTERDVLRAVAAGVVDTDPVARWMTRDPETAEPDDTIEHAAALMIHGGFRHLPVVEGGAVTGVVSIRDLMGAVLDDTAPRGA